MEFLEVPLIDDDIFKLFVRFALNVFFLTLIVRYAIFPSQREREFAFTAVMMNVTVFFICFSMKKLELGIGMALGLFAIFGVLRYRTDAIRVKEMTYLFIVIGIAVINSLSNRKTSYAELLVINSVIFATALLKEGIVRRQRKYSVQYDKLAWLGAEHRADLLADLQERTGMNVVGVEVQRIDLRKATATLSIWCEDTSSTNDEGSLHDASGMSEGAAASDAETPDGSNTMNDPPRQDDNQND